MTSDVLLAMGETMAVVVPVDGPVNTAADFFVDAGGAESNVLAHAAALGVRTRWHSRLGADALGERVLRQLSSRGIDVRSVIEDSGHPTGLYVKDPGSGVVYYRAGSAASWLDETDAETAPYEDVALLHVSGITAAISDRADRFLRSAVRRARVLGVPVSFDVNYRAALWTVTEAAPVLADLARLADVVFVGRDEAETLWGTSSPDDVRAAFPGIEELVVKDGAIGGTVFVGSNSVFVPSRTVAVRDVIGAGDAFAGGYIAARMRGEGLVERLQGGHDRAALTLALSGDSIPGGTS